MSCPGDYLTYPPTLHEQRTKGQTRRAESPPRFTPAPLTPHAYVPMLAWPGCYRCLQPRWHRIHANPARLSPAKGTDGDG